MSNKPPAPWLFMLTGMPYGIVGGFVATTMPYFTRKAGLSIEQVGWYGTALMLPPVLQFLYAPLVDLGPKRRVWLVLVSIVAAACLAAAMTMRLPEQQTPYLVLIFLGQLISGLVGSCNGGILATSMPAELRGKAAGYLNVGNLAGGALGAWLTLTMAETYNFSPLVVGLALAALMIAPSFVALTIDEPTRERRTAREAFGQMRDDVWRVIRSRAGWSGILICSSPVGTAALINYFAGLAPDYHASANMVAFINGPVNGVVTAVGALIGGYLCDRVNRRAMYLGSGAATAVCAVVMMTMPLVAMTYAIGVTVYLFIAGFCYSSFTAMALEAIGKGGASAGTQYTLFTSACNFAIAYVGWIDTRFHEKYGVRGLLAVDAGANVLGIVLLGLFIALVYNRINPSSNVEAT